MKRYAESHEWIEITGDGTARIGISDYAQSELGDIVFVDLPDVGDSFNAGGEFATVESVKAASEIYLPIAGKITAVNEALEDDPQLVNSDAEDAGWLVEIEIEDAEAALAELRDAESYAAAHQD